ncbi:hypothetical protein VCV18_010090 [Metarhizium anisopliae]
MGFAVNKLDIPSPNALQSKNDRIGYHILEQARMSITVCLCKLLRASFRRVEYREEAQEI